MTSTTKKGILYTVAAPSGAGKTSLVKALLDNIESLKVSISYTTRPARDGEVDGVNYRFVDHDTFKQMVENNEFLEHAQVFQYHYGTSNHWVEKQLEKGNSVILEIDWQGVQQIKSLFPDCVRIFILPPSIGVLTERLQARGKDEPAVIARRMQAARDEISHYAEAELVVVNDDFEQTVTALEQFICHGTVSDRQNQEENQLLAKKLLQQ